MIVFVPLELIHRILESGYYAPSGTPNYQLLKACTLVRRTWSRPAQALLFRSPPRIDYHYLQVLCSTALFSSTETAYEPWTYQLGGPTSAAVQMTS